MKRVLVLLIASVIVIMSLPVIVKSSTTEIIEVYLQNRGITDEQLSEMVKNGRIPQNVTSLNLRDNQITDLTPLAGLTNLGRGVGVGLILDNNQITDLSPLANLTNLTALTLQNNQITDVTPLQNLSNLWLLDLRDNDISDVTPLATLTGLDSTSLVLRGNPVADDTAQLELLEAAREANRTRTTLTLGHVLGEIPYTIADALEVLRYTIGLSSVLDECPIAVMAALVISEEHPNLADALQILRYAIGLDLHESG